ncbi:putative transcription factor homeobox-WOX family [Helianthus anomalus]
MICLALIYKPYFHLHNSWSHQKLPTFPILSSTHPFSITKRIIFPPFKSMIEEERCNTTLGLGIGTGVVIQKEKQSKNYKKRGFWLDLSLPLHPNIEANDHDHKHKHDDEKDKYEDSFRSKTIDDDDEEEEQRTNKSITSNTCNNNDGSRKKLKLTNEQTTLLEASFNIRSTLNTGQKQELAKKLKLLPRQIEVWFQNRRARFHFHFRQIIINQT